MMLVLLTAAPPNPHLCPQGKEYLQITRFMTDNSIESDTMYTKALITYVFWM